MKKAFFFMAAILPLLTSCHSTKSLSGDTQGLTTSSHDCAMDKAKDQTVPMSFEMQILLQQIAGKDENSVLSPVSAAMALNMLTPGAKGKTLAELQKIVPVYSPDTTKALKIASALWIAPTLPVKQTYLEANQNNEIYVEPLRVARINQWAAEHTNGKINNILDKLQNNIRLVLTNAVYFKQDWASPFMAEATRKQAFHPQQGETYQTDMMHKQQHYRYAETEFAQIVRLPYRGQQYCMDIILPREGLDLQTALKGLDIHAIAWNTKKVNLSLPKVKVEYERMLNEDLQQMGLQQIFSATKADLSGMSDERLFVDFVKQKTYFCMDEQGTEAAAVTAIGFATACAPTREEIIEMQVNRPFILLLREQESGTVLFSGVIRRP